MTALLLLIGALSGWLPQQSGSTTSQLRGVTALDATRAWASGSEGTILRTRDGKTWEKLRAPAGGEALDFRDIEAIGDTVVLMSAGPGDASRIYRSTDGGATWKLTHTNPDKDGFYDAIAFWDAKNGIVLGDPVDGRFVIRTTEDGGATWKVPEGLAIYKSFPGEGAFAASGTCLFALKGGNDAWFVTGGAKVSRVFHTINRGRNWSSWVTPVAAGNPSSGLFSVTFLDNKRGFAAGGDYKQPQFAGLNGVRTEDGGQHWTAAPISATGFMSAVVPVPGTGTDLVAVGLAGEAVSHDAGRTWTSTGKEPMNAAVFSAVDTGWAVGPKGMILRFSAAR
jgi:photosystem II stability/assembly factor-like uncharacterized protein